MDERGIKTPFRTKSTAKGVLFRPITVSKVPTVYGKFPSFRVKKCFLNPRFTVKKISGIKLARAPRKLEPTEVGDKGTRSNGCWDGKMGFFPDSYWCY